MKEKSVVKNAADPKQIKKGKREERNIRDVELDDIKEVLRTPQGRRFMWRVMAKCKTFESIWESSAKIHYNSGQQDLGHFIMSEIIQADEDLLFTMMKENKQGENNVAR